MPNGNIPGAVPQSGIAPGNQLTKPAGDNFNVAAHVENGWQQAQQQHKTLLQAQKRMDAARGELDALRKLGDGVQVEDVIKGAGTMVGAGFSPQAMAQLLAQMPTTGGQALEAWVAQQDERAQQMDAQLKQKIQSSAIHRGLAAMASLHVDHIKGLEQKKQAAMAGAPLGAPAIGGALAPQSQPEEEADQTPSPANAGEGG